MISNPGTKVFLLPDTDRDSVRSEECFDFR